MKYHYQEGVIFDKKRRVPLAVKFLLVLLVLAAVTYAVAVVWAPVLKLPFVEDPPADRVAKMMAESKPGQHGDRLYIPQLNIDAPIEAEEDSAVLRTGVWHRRAQQSDPAAGGNVQICGSRHVIGLTPQETREKSLFYHLNELSQGDVLFVDYKDKRYAYKVERLYEDAIESIPAQSDEAKLSLYFCTPTGSQEGKLIVEAKPEGEVTGVVKSPE